MAKYSCAFKLQVVQYYLSNNIGFKRTANHFGINFTLVRKWVHLHKHFGPDALEVKAGRAHYSAEFKVRVVSSVKSEGLSLRDAVLRFGPLEAPLVLQWIRLYDQGGLDALQSKQRGRKTTMKSHQPPKMEKVDSQKTQQELLEELVYLRAEVAYLKKRKALILETTAHQTKPVSCQD